MTIRDLIRTLGGGAMVARELGVTPQAVSHWCVANEAPRGHHIALWRMALAAGLSWEPPGADAIREKLRAAVPAPAKVA